MNIFKDLGREFCFPPCRYHLSVYIPKLCIVINIYHTIQLKLTSSTNTKRYSERGDSARDVYLVMGFRQVIDFVVISRGYNISYLFEFYDMESKLCEISTLDVLTPPSKVYFQKGNYVDN